MYKNWDIDQNSNGYLQAIGGLSEFINNTFNAVSGSDSTAATAPVDAANDLMVTDQILTPTSPVSSAGSSWSIPNSNIFGNWFFGSAPLIRNGTAKVMQTVRVQSSKK